MRSMAQKNDRVELEMKIVKYRSLARQATDDETTQRIKTLVAELEQKLREIDESGRLSWRPDGSASSKDRMTVKVCLTNSASRGPRHEPSSSISAAGSNGFRKDLGCGPAWVLAVAGAVDARPPQIVVRFSQAVIANERRFRSHGPVLAFHAGYDGRWPDRYNGKSRTPSAILRPTAPRPDAPMRRA
jgi:hypothetical protein